MSSNGKKKAPSDLLPDDAQPAVHARRERGGLPSGAASSLLHAPVFDERASMQRSLPANQTNPKTGCSYRPFAPPHGLPVSRSPRRALRSWPDISPPTVRQRASPFGHLLPASTVSGLGADPRGLPVACSERTASRLSLHRRSPPGLSSLGILAFRPCGPLGSHTRTIKALAGTLTGGSRPIFFHSPSASIGMRCRIIVPESLRPYQLRRSVCLLEPSLSCTE